MMLETFWLLLCTAPALAWGGESPVVVMVLLLLGSGVAVFASFLPARPAPPAAAGVIAALLALASLSTYLSISPLSSTWTLGWWLLLAFTWRVIQGHIDGFAGLTRLLAAAATVATLVAVLGLVDTFVHRLAILGPRPYGGQVSGPFVNPSHMVSHLLLTFPATVVLACAARHAGARWYFGAAALVQLLAIVFSRSRGGWIGATLALLTLAAGGRHRRQLVGLLLCIALAAGARLAVTPISLEGLKQRLATLSPRSNQALDYFGRLGPWGVALTLVRERPHAGWGPDCFREAFFTHRPAGYYYRPSHAHCEPLEYGVELGAGGILLPAVLVFLHIQLGRQALEKAPNPGSRLLVVALLAGFSGTALTTLWDWPLRVPATALLAAGLAGALAGVAHDAPPGPGRSPLLWCLLLAVPVWLVTSRLQTELARRQAHLLAQKGERAQAAALLDVGRRSWPSLGGVASEEADLLGQLLTAARSDSTMAPAKLTMWRKMAVRAALGAATAQSHDPDAFRTLGRMLASFALEENWTAPDRDRWLDLTVESFQMACSLDPSHHLPYLELGNILWAAGRREAALDAYRACLDRYPVERIGEIPEIVNQMVPVATSLAAPLPRTNAPSLEMAVRLLELRKARAPGDFRSYRLLEQLYLRAGMQAQAEAERQEEEQATRLTASGSSGPDSRPRK